MGDEIQNALDWLDTQRGRAVSLVEEWCNINTGSYNLAGLEILRTKLAAEFSKLPGALRQVELPLHRIMHESGHFITRPLGKAIVQRIRETAPRRALVGIHYDTVYPSDHSFQNVIRVDENTLRGPGVADAKGGLVVLLVALECIERVGITDLGYDIVLNPDEEIGSPGSAPWFSTLAQDNQIGLFFEPPLLDGSLVKERKGSGNFTIIVRGRSAHAGRDFRLGRNAILAMSGLMLDLARPIDNHPDITINIGRVAGGGPVNVVPDLAACFLNVRYSKMEQQRLIQDRLHAAVAQANELDGISAELHGDFTAPPKPCDDKARWVMSLIENAAVELNLPNSWGDSGGVSDGNRLAAAGLPTIDTLGPRGGSIHSTEEFLKTDSLIEKAKLTALTLLKFAEKEPQMNPARRSRNQSRKFAQGAKKLKDCNTDKH